MYSVLYYRNDAKVSDLREFKNLDELNQWLDLQRKLKDNIDIISIVENERRNKNG